MTTFVMNVYTNYPMRSQVENVLYYGCSINNTTSIMNMSATLEIPYIVRYIPPHA